MTKNDLFTKIRAFQLSAAKATRQQALDFFEGDIKKLKTKADQEEAKQEIGSFWH